MRQTLEIVEKIVDHDFIAWIFPLPVVPMYTSALRHLKQPSLERLPDGLWDVLYVSWRHNLKITRRLAPVLLQNLRNKIVSYMIDKIFNSIDWLFQQLKETRGKFSQTLSHKY